LIPGIPLSSRKEKDASPSVTTNKRGRKSLTNNPDYVSIAEGGFMNKILSVFYGAVVTIGCMTLSAAERDYSERGIDPLVSTEWLASHLNDSDLLVIDGRDEHEYSAGHIPQSGNVPVGKWWVNKNGLLLELPDPEMLRDLIGKAGIGSDTKVVLVNKSNNDFDRGHATRWAWTLIYGGVKSVAILDGGFNKWESEGKAISREAFTPKPKNYTGAFQEKIVVSKSEVESYLLNSPDTTILLDNRMPEDFFGVSPWMVGPKAGHIAGALCLPISWAFTAKGTYRARKELEAIAAGLIGSDLQKRIILYCGVGGYAPTWWFVFSEILGYQNVQVYDGSIEDWIKDPDAPVIQYRW